MGHGHHGGGHAKRTKELRDAASNKVTTEIVVTDVNALLRSMFPWADTGQPTKSGQTDFEGRKLNEMLDLVKHAKPSHLTQTGQAFWDARDAISDAAEELRGHVKDVDWHGEAGTSFRNWATGLVANAHSLAAYASHAGAQLRVAGSGLSSVSRSMPPRDERVHKKTVEEIPEHKRVKGNPEYDEAVKVEGHRQEAINQMNRLASFYSVTSSALAKEKPPEFKQMKNVGVPKPTTGLVDGSGSGRTESGTLSRQGGVSDTRSVGGDSDGLIAPAHLNGHQVIDELTPPPMRTEIDSAPPTLTHAPPPHTDPGPAPIGPGPGPGPNNPTLPVAPGPLNQGGQQIPKPLGKSPGPLTRGPGRDAVSDSKNTSQMGRVPRNTMGRGLTAQGKSTGHAGRMPMGRGITGGKPRTVGPSKSFQAGATRKDGVVGGKPSSGRPSEGVTRTPRGTVIGGRQPGADPSKNSKGKLQQRGVIGASNPDQKGRTTPMRRAPKAPEGVNAEPKERTARLNGQRGGFTQGGSGLVRDNGERHRDHDRYPLDENGQPLPQETEGGQTPTSHRPPHTPPATD